MSNGIKSPRIKKDRYSLPFRVPKIGEIYQHGQELKVVCKEGHEFLPCFPRDLNGGEPITRIPNNTWITYLSTMEWNGAEMLEFWYRNTSIMLGFGVVPFLINIPKKNPRRVGFKRGIRRAPILNNHIVAKQQINPEIVEEQEKEPVVVPPPPRSLKGKKGRLRR